MKKKEYIYRWISTLAGRSRQRYILVRLHGDGYAEVKTHSRDAHPVKHPGHEFEAEDGSPAFPGNAAVLGLALASGATVSFVKGGPKSKGGGQRVQVKVRYTPMKHLVFINPDTGRKIPRSPSPMMGHDAIRAYGEGLAASGGEIVR